SPSPAANLVIALNTLRAESGFPAFTQACMTSSKDILSGAHSLPPTVISCSNATAVPTSSSGRSPHVPPSGDDTPVPDPTVPPPGTETPFRIALPPGIPTVTPWPLTSSRPPP
ncbi:unnamed protein product, partial [Ectocarpus fasciculatus]